MNPWRLLLFTLALATAFLRPGGVDAASCCMSAAVGGNGRLLSWERGAAGVRGSFLHGVGIWNKDALWLPYEGDYSEEEFRAELWAMVGIGKKLSLDVRVPWVFTGRTSVGTTEWGNGAGDVRLGGRYELLSLGEHKVLPAVALFLGCSMPAGTATHASRMPLGTDVSTRGAWVLTTGFQLEKTFPSLFLRTDFFVSVPLPLYREDIDAYQRFGVSANVGAIVGVELAPGLVTSLLLRFLWEGDLTIRSKTIPNSHRMDFGVGVTLAWRFHPHVTLQLGVDTGMFVPFFGDNQWGRLTFSAGLRFGFF